MVRAKFYVASNKGQGTVLLNPVVGNSEENKEFYKWTPAGQITLSTINEQASAYFEEGKEYYVDFTIATPPTPAT